jgi:soluble lytic murein transglycosylase-like protein
MRGNAMKKFTIAAMAAAFFVPVTQGFAEESSLHRLIAQHAQANGVPLELVHRVVRRESNYNPRAVGHGGAMGLMQIKVTTARAMGYSGPASGLLDADTNLTYAVRYLGGAYRVASGNHDRAVSYYARGFYYEAKRRNLPTMWVRYDGQPARKAPPRDVTVTASVAQEPSSVPAVDRSLYDNR